MNRYELENALTLYLHSSRDLPHVMALIDDYVASQVNYLKTMIADKRMVENAMAGERYNI